MGTLMSLVLRMRGGVFCQITAAHALVFAQVTFIRLIPCVSPDMNHQIGLDGKHPFAHVALVGSFAGVAQDVTLEGGSGPEFLPAY